MYVYAYAAHLLIHEEDTYKGVAQCFQLTWFKLHLHLRCQNLNVSSNQTSEFGSLSLVHSVIMT